MIIKGGDVEQLITTPYAQPYVQIVSQHILTASAQPQADHRPHLVLQRHTKHFREHCLDCADLCPADLRHHQPSHNNLATAVVICS